ncbi:hypothetical protein OG21DRAFT_519457 [Imleria badia]|nr:hypothetical protein OG21DRAFT_519457 [Imleria badia]
MVCEDHGRQTLAPQRAMKTRQDTACTAYHGATPRVARRQKKRQETYVTDVELRGLVHKLFVVSGHPDVLEDLPRWMRKRKRAHGGTPHGLDVPNVTWVDFGFNLLLSHETPLCLREVTFLKFLRLRGLHFRIRTFVPLAPGRLTWGSRGAQRAVEYLSCWN